YRKARPPPGPRAATDHSQACHHEQRHGRSGDHCRYGRYIACPVLRSREVISYPAHPSFHSVLKRGKCVPCLARELAKQPAQREMVLAESTMLERSIELIFRCAWRDAAVDSATTVFHRRGLAQEVRLPASRQTSRVPLQVQGLQVPWLHRVAPQLP